MRRYFPAALLVLLGFVTGASAQKPPSPRDPVATPAEQISRNKEMNAFMSTDDRKALAGSGQRATYRKIMGDMLLQQLVFQR